MFSSFGLYICHRKQDSYGERAPSLNVSMKDDLFLERYHPRGFFVVHMDRENMKRPKVTVNHTTQDDFNANWRLLGWTHFGRYLISFAERHFVSGNICIC